MRNVGDRGWRFCHPDMGSASGVGLRLTNRGGIELIRGDGSVRQAIYLLLSTRRGERVMRPEFGCELDRLVFLPNDVTTAGLAIHYTRRALERWEPRIEILHVDASADPHDASRLDISLSYRVEVTGNEDTLSLSLSLSGEGE